jgi:cytochrome P450
MTLTDPGTGATGTTAADVPKVMFNPFEPGYFDDPSVQLNALREQEPVHFMEFTGGYLLTRYNDVFRVLRDRSIGSEATHAIRTPSIEAELDQIAKDPSGRSMLRVDGDDHTRLRRLVAQAFTPRAIERWRIRATELTEELLDCFEDRGGGDALFDFALPLPATVISDMLGMPAGDLPKLRGWSHALAKTLDAVNTDEERQRAVESAAAMDEYLRGIYDRKAADPADDIFSALIAAEHDGDRLTKDEVMSNIRLLYVAGHETTTNLIGNGLVELFRHPDQLALLRSTDDHDANVVEEVLRFNPSVQMTRRIPLHDVEIAGTPIPAGSVMLLSATAANRDPRKWGDTADEFDITRPDAKDQVAFGGGPHFCLGAALARLEGQIAIPRIVRRFPDLAPVNDTPEFEPRVVLRGVSRLDVTV